MRRSYIDWLRGVAVLAMIEWHVLDSWTIRDDRDTAAWTTLQTFGGYAAPLFLFLAGLAAPLAIDARQQRGADLRDAAWSVQKRGWQIFGIAHLFRLQSFLINPQAQWTAIFLPDILNILGLGLAATAWLSGRALRSKPAIGALWLIVPALLVLWLTPMSQQWQWPALMHLRLETYIRPVQGISGFSLFPWVAYVPMGALIGLLLVHAKDEARERRVLISAAGAGLAAIGISSLIDVGHVIFRTGLMTIALAASRWLVSVQPARLTAPLLLFGQTSLFVYWLHVELAYGGWSYPLHSALTLGWALAGVVAMAVAMYYAGRWWKNRPTGRPWIPERLRSGTELATCVRVQSSRDGQRNLR